MATPVTENRLADTHSPYLRQHADNPVHWQPWDASAREAAAEHDVPIFLSIGYAACHWCHVMEAESFEDEAIAARLNQSFVPIKVDREEHPAVDRIYQTVCQLVAGNGGWPLSAFLFPDGRPFYVGTYFPPEPRHGRPSFGGLLDRITESWDTDRVSLEERADEWQRALRSELEVTEPVEATQPAAPLRGAADAAVRTADPEFGGFGQNGPKFPQPRRIELLLRTAARTGESRYREVACDALDAMASGGIYDHVGGGFHRYATDRAWRVPHFEKMLYDNAEIPRVAIEAYRLTGQEQYAVVTEGTIAFLERELHHDDGGFFSTLDAQSEGREGAYYVWTPAGVHDAIDDPDLADLFCDRYGVSDAGNFEGGTSVLALDESIEELAEAYDMDDEEVIAAIERARRNVFTARDERVRPRRDEKILAGWNGLIAAMLVEAGLTFDERYLEVAADCLGFVREHCWEPNDGWLDRRYHEGAVGIAGTLDDYAYLARGTLSHYEATGDLASLTWARQLADAIVERFFDPDAGTLYFTAHDGESLVTRPQDLPDQSLPSSTGVAVDVLATLASVDPDAQYGDVARTVTGTHESRMTSSPLQHPTLVMAADRLDRGNLEITLAAGDRPTGWNEFLGKTYLPNRFVSQRPPTDGELEDWLDALGLTEAPPIWRERTAGEEGIAYVCRDFACSPPLADPSDARDWLAGEQSPI